MRRWRKPERSAIFKSSGRRFLRVYYSMERGMPQPDCDSRRCETGWHMAIQPDQPNQGYSSKFGAERRRFGGAASLPGIWMGGNDWKFLDSSMRLHLRHGRSGLRQYGKH